MPMATIAPTVKSAPYFVSSPAICTESTMPVKSSVNATMGKDSTPNARHCFIVSRPRNAPISFTAAIRSRITAPS